MHSSALAALQLQKASWPVLTGQASSGTFLRRLFAMTTSSQRRGASVASASVSRFQPIASGDQRGRRHAASKSDTMVPLTNRKGKTWHEKRFYSSSVTEVTEAHPFRKRETDTGSNRGTGDLGLGLVVDTASESASATTLKSQTPNQRRRRVYPDGSVNATGRRKTAVAVVRIFPVEARSKDTQSSELRQMQMGPRFRVNGQNMADYFHRVDHRLEIMRPFMVTGTEKKFHVHAFVRGGGITGQAEALRLSIARALEDFDRKFRSELKPAGLLTRDPRMVERKKYGRHKARRAFQWVKR